MVKQYWELTTATGQPVAVFTRKRDVDKYLEFLKVDKANYIIIKRKMV